MICNLFNLTRFLNAYTTLSFTVAGLDIFPVPLQLLLLALSQG